MRRLFADTLYYQALLDRGDQWHPQVQVVAERYQTVPVVTTEEVLVEVLAGLRDGPERRRIAVEAVRELFQDPNTEVIHQSHDTFMAGLELFAARRDKGYSLTDCISMQTMRKLGIHEVLTHDEHFVQEGFLKLIPD